MIWDTPSQVSANINKILVSYTGFFLEDISRYNLLREQISSGEDIASRKNFKGHLTSSVILLDANKRNILFVNHLKLKRLIQPGGHYEIGEPIEAAALRELEEETGLSGAKLSDFHCKKRIPIDIDTHKIPENPKKGEPAHFHHDFRYVAMVDDRSVIKIDQSEVTGYQWIAVDDVAREVSGLRLAVERLGSVGIL